MNYLTLEELKKQLIIEADFTEDDAYIASLGNVAEQMVNDHLNGLLNEVVADNNNEIPATLKHAMLMIADYLYDYRGSGDERTVPDAYFVLCKPYINYYIG